METRDYEKEDKDAIKLAEQVLKETKELEKKKWFFG